MSGGRHGSTLGSEGGGAAGRGRHDPRGWRRRHPGGHGGLPLRVAHVEDAVSRETLVGRQDLVSSCVVCLVEALGATAVVEEVLGQWRGARAHGHGLE